jgi:hypothetical protein
MLAVLQPATVLSLSTQSPTIAIWCLINLSLRLLLTEVSTFAPSLIPEKEGALHLLVRVTFYKRYRYSCL